MYRLFSFPESSKFSLTRRSGHIRGSGCLHSAPVWRFKQAEGHKGDLHPLHLRHGHWQHSVCVRCGHRCNHQEQPERLRALLNFKVCLFLYNVSSQQPKQILKWVIKQRSSNQAYIYIFVIFELNFQ